MADYTITRYPLSRRSYWSTKEDGGQSPICQWRTPELVSLRDYLTPRGNTRLRHQFIRLINLELARREKSCAS